MTRHKGKIDRSFFDDILGEVEEAGAPPESAELPLDQIAPRADQFRRNFDQASIEALAASVDDVGLLEPVVVRPQGEGFEIVAGERRYRALRLLGWERAPVRIVAFDDAQAELAGAVENLNREDLGPLEEVDAVLSVLQHALGRPRDEVVATIIRVRSLELEDKQSADGEAKAVTRLFKSLGYTSVNSFYANRLSLLRYPEDLLRAMRSRPSPRSSSSLSSYKQIDRQQDDWENVNFPPKAFLSPLPSAADAYVWPRRVVQGDA